MKLPYGDAANPDQIVEKLETYALDFNHSSGKHKARLFRSKLGDAMKTIHLHDIVALMEDLPAQRFPLGGQILLRRGQVGTVVEELGNGEAYEIEFSLSDGQAYAMLAVKAEQLLPLYYEPVDLAAAS